MQKESMIAAGAILVVVAVIGVIVAQPRYEEAKRVAWFESVQRGNQMRMTADLIKYGSLGVGALGLGLFIAGLLKEHQNKLPQLPRMDPRDWGGP